MSTFDSPVSVSFSFFVIIWYRHCLYIAVDMKSDETFPSYLGGVQNSSLINILDANKDDTGQNKPQLLCRSSYYDIDKFHIVSNKNKYNYI